MKQSLVLLALMALAMASSTEARRLWQFPSLGGAATSPAATTVPAAGDAATGTSVTAPAGAAAATGGAGAAPGGAAAGAIPIPTPGSTATGTAATAPTTGMPGAGGAGIAPATGMIGTGGAGAAPSTTGMPGGAGTAPTTTLPGAGGAGTAPTTTTATATATSDATATGTAAEPAVATADAVGTPSKPGAAVAVASNSQGVGAGATGPSTATAAAGDEAVTAVGEEEEPAAPAGPKVLRPGVYVIADPPPPPKVKPAAATANLTAGRNVTAGPPMPAPGKNLMVVMTVMGQQARDIYKNQKGLRDQVAQAAGVGSNQVLFYNQTTNQDPRTGVTAMSLIMNVDCKDQAECAQAGMKLFNSSSQTKLTDALARNSISMLPGTFQVYGVQQMGRYKGNETLYENKALTTIKPKTSETDMDYNATLARVFAGMEDEPTPTKGGKKTPAGALPGDIPLAGTPGLFGNFSIPMDNFTMPQSSFAGIGNATQLQPLGGAMGILPSDLPGLQNATDEEPAPAHRAKSSAGVFSTGVLPLVAAAVAVLVL